MPLSEQLIPNYQPATQLTGRMDDLRMHQIIHPLDIRTENLQAGDFVILGMKCDIGVERNLGRVGTVNGPEIIRERLATFPMPEGLKQQRIVDVGNIFVEGTDLESAHRQFRELVEHILSNGGIPICFGGGYDMVLPVARANMQPHSDKNLTIVSMSPFSNLRSLDNGKGNSGTTFRQIAKECEHRNIHFDYLIYGFQKLLNTPRLLRRMQKLNVEAIEAKDIMSDKTSRRKNAWRQFKRFVTKHDHILLTMEMNVFAEPFAPGVSAVSPFGLLPEQGRRAMTYLAKKGKLAGIVIAEVNPEFDSRNGSTGRLAAGLTVETIGSMNQARRN